MSETVTERGMNGANGADVVDPHEAEARDRWKIYSAVFGALFALTIMELYVNQLIADQTGRVAALIALMLTKAALVVLYYMHLRWESRVFRWLVLIPFFAAVFFVVILLWV